MFFYFAFSGSCFTLMLIEYQKILSFYCRSVCYVQVNPSASNMVAEQRVGPISVSNAAASCEAGPLPSHNGNKGCNVLKHYNEYYFH